MKSLYFSNAGFIIECKFYPSDPSSFQQQFIENIIIFFKQYLTKKKDRKVDVVIEIHYEFKVDQILKKYTKRNYLFLFERITYTIMKLNYEKNHIHI